MDAPVNIYSGIPAVVVDGPAVMRFRSVSHNDYNDVVPPHGSRCGHDTVRYKTLLKTRGDLVPELSMRCSVSFFLRYTDVFYVSRCIGTGDCD